jgi:hypothetical protein
MDNLPSTSYRNFSFGSIIKAIASGTTIGSMVVSLINDEQSKNIEDVLQKHKEQLEMLKEIVIGELFVNKEKYFEELKAALQKAKDEAVEEKRRLYASYLTACCHPENSDKGNRRIFLDLVEKIDINGIRILKGLTTRYNGKAAVDYFTSLFEGELSKDDIIIQLDYLTSYRLIEKCTQEEIERNNDYSIFTLSICPEFDFYQEILWNAEDMEVLEPNWLRNEIGGIVKRMWNKYKK